MQHNDMEAHPPGNPSGADSRVLATDLDGTFIPLEGNAQNAADLITLQSELQLRNAGLVFVTGRHLASVLRGIEQHNLPTPATIICDVGTSIYECSDAGKPELVAPYAEYLAGIVASVPTEKLRQTLAEIEGLTPQEDEKQGRFKLSYYADADRLDELVARVQAVLDQTAAPYSMIHSVDPFNGDGLIDLLPTGVSKAFALRWWAGQQGLSHDDLVFAGDSGNDLAALTAGFRAIVVANADRTVARQAYEAHRQAGGGRLFLADSPATSGVLEGCRWFGLAEPAMPDPDWLGAVPCSHNQTAFRVWAPKHWSVGIEVTDATGTHLHPIKREKGGGYHSGVIRGVGLGTLYRYRLDGGGNYPDPASKRQPEGVHGPSEVVNPKAFAWTDAAWQGVAKQDLIIYELHVGAFTPEGTFRAAIERIPHLVELGVTAVELMPLAQTPGKWNWGYDGVGLFAPRSSYGEPDDLKALVDACHASGLAVLLDVVYNHLGPEGNYLPRFGPYASAKHHTPWGDALNFDGRLCKMVRSFVVGNALYWLREFHIDGLRLDAIHFMHDRSTPHVLQEMREAVDGFAQSSGRHLHLIGESNSYDAELIAAPPGGPTCDAIWCDCLMYAIYSIAAPHLQLVNREYRGRDDVVQALRQGYVYSGRSFDRCAPLPPGEDTRLASLVTAVQTHDSVGNHPQGLRIHQLASPSFQKAAVALQILHPTIPLFFMGEEWAAESPFPFFVDFHDRHLRRTVDRAHRGLHSRHGCEDGPLPSSRSTFLSAKLPADGDDGMLSWYRELITLRKRGLAEGWLSPERMTAGYDAQLDAFWIRYEKEQGHSVCLYARLQGPASGATPAATSLPLPGNLLFSSEPQTRQGHIEVRRNHAVVVESPGQSVT